VIVGRSPAAVTEEGLPPERRRVGALARQRLRGSSHDRVAVTWAILSAGDGNRGTQRPEWHCLCGGRTLCPSLVRFLPRWAPRLERDQDGPLESRFDEMRSTKAASKSKAGSRAMKARGSIKKRSLVVAKTRPARSTSTKVMGLRVPKTLTSALDTLINSPRGREILAGAIVAAASAAAAALMKSSDRQQVAKAREAAADAGSQVTKEISEVAAGVVADMVTGAVRTLLPASLTGENTKKSGD
jgi:hypothetical protein